RRRAAGAGARRRAGHAHILQRIHPAPAGRDAPARPHPRRARRARRGLSRAALSRRLRTRERPARRGDRDGHGRGHRGLCGRARGGAGMTVNPSGWRPEAPTAEAGGTATYTGNRALMLEEPLIFEIGTTETTGVDFSPLPFRGGVGGGEQDGALRASDNPLSQSSPLTERGLTDRLAGLRRTAPMGLPGLSEPEAVRHYTRLSRQNYAIDLGLFPLGSCTMKHNPRLNE